jgi:hypothetical protein
VNENLPRYNATTGHMLLLHMLDGLLTWTAHSEHQEVWAGPPWSSYAFKVRSVRLPGSQDPSKSVLLHAPTVGFVKNFMMKLLNVSVTSDTVMQAYGLTAVPHHCTAYKTQKVRLQVPLHSLQKTSAGQLQTSCIPNTTASVSAGAIMAGKR